MITISIDPGSSSTGIAIFRQKTKNYDELIYSNQGKPDKMLQEVKDAVGGEGADAKTKIFAIENLYPGPGRASVKSIYALGAVTGYIIGRCKEMQLYDESTWLWRPYPVSWRKHIVVPTADGDSTMNAKGRDVAADMAIHFAQAVSQDAMMGPRGGPQIDRAMAICIGIAAQIEHTKTKAKATGVESWMKTGNG